MMNNANFELYFENLFNKWWYEKMMNIGVEEDIAKHQKRLHQAIIDYRFQLTKEEKAMLKELNRNCLLLDIREVLETDLVYLEAYNINYERIFRKRVKF
jgi:hypothetical protein